MTNAFNSLLHIAFATCFWKKPTAVLFENVCVTGIMLDFIKSKSLKIGMVISKIKG